MLVIVSVVLVSALAFRVWTDVLPLLDRLVTVHESRHARLSEPQEPMPQHLVTLAQAQGSEWATDDLIAAMQEAYAETKDWTKVASQFTDAGRDVTHMRIAL